MSMTSVSEDCRGCAHAEFEDVHMMILLPDQASIAAFRAEDAELFSAAAAAAAASHDSASSVIGGAGDGADAQCAACGPAPAAVDPLAVGVVDDVVVELGLAGACRQMWPDVGQACRVNLVSFVK